MPNNKIKVCYILPKFDLNTDTHYFYLYDFVERATEELDIFLLIEKNFSDINYFKNVKKIYCQKFSKQPLRFLENFIILFRIRTQGYNNFYVHYSYISAFNSSIIARFTRARTFYWNCGLLWLFGRDIFFEIVLRAVNYLVTGVSILKHGYMEHYRLKAEKVKIMPNWVDLDRFKAIDTSPLFSKYSLENGKKYILFVHRLSKRKGVHYISKIAQNFINNPEIKFLVAGDGPDKNKLVEEIKNLGNVVLLGKVPNSDIPGLMKISKLFFMPSEEEGFPRVLLEAMATGLPYVAFAVGGVREISSASQQEYICPLGDTDTMSFNIKKILGDEGIQQKLIESNYQQVLSYDISKAIKIFIGLFK